MKTLMPLPILPTLSAALLLASPLASAQTPDQELARCAAIAEAGPRLACLDALAAAAVARLRPEAQAAAQAKAREQAFGTQPALKSAPSATAAAPVLPSSGAADTLESEIEGFVDSWRPNTHFKLKNGQVWRVSDGSSGEIGLRNPKVKVRRNFFGTYFLEFAGRNAAPKVRRVE